MSITVNIMLLIFIERSGKFEKGSAMLMSILLVKYLIIVKRFLCRFGIFVTLIVRQKLNCAYLINFKYALFFFMIFYS